MHALSACRGTESDLEAVFVKPPTNINMPIVPVKQQRKRKEETKTQYQGRRQSKSLWDSCLSVLGSSVMVPLSSLDLLESICNEQKWFKDTSLFSLKLIFLGEIHSTFQKRLT